jgi:hypothetical protein
MAHTNLSNRDANVLEKIKDPESEPGNRLLIDPELPKDPHVTEPSAYERVSRREREIVVLIQKAEMQSARQNLETYANTINEYRSCISDLDSLILEFPTYSSARNNRAQALRRLYGDTMLAGRESKYPPALLQNIDPVDMIIAARKTLSDLDTCISLLTPPTPWTAMSPHAAKTLGMAHTQKALMALAISKIPAIQIPIELKRKEVGWTRLDFEDNASRDFALAGRYGNDMAKALAVRMNPTAKLCGQIVREAIRREYGTEVFE